MASQEGPSGRLPVLDPAVDVAIVGGGAAGLLTAIQVGRRAPNLRVAVLDGAERLGRKILISGGGRCNVTHRKAEPGDFCGATPAAIRKVLRQWSVEDTRAFFAGLNVPLKEEPTGKLFPVANKARTVLDALLRACSDAGVMLCHPARVTAITRAEGGFELRSSAGQCAAQCVVLATGGRSLPQTGSDGVGYSLARGLGHTLTPWVGPSLVPLVVDPGEELLEGKGIAHDVALSVRAKQGRLMRRVEGALLLTHFGVSGPAVLDISRTWLKAQAEGACPSLHVSWLPEATRESTDTWLRGLGAQPLGKALATHLPQRLARMLLDKVGLDPQTSAAQLQKAARKALGQALTNYRLDVRGDRGWAYAEVTAGGIPLREVDLRTMASRKAPGLYLVGEILDVDGRIGGFNFQWAWATGVSAGRALAAQRTSP